MLQFGHGLQQMLTIVPYSEIAGQRNVEWDALQVCAKFMSMLLYHPYVLRKITSHFDTGEPMAEELIENVVKGMMSNKCEYSFSMTARVGTYTCTKCEFIFVFFHNVECCTPDVLV